jgi:PilZ domain
MYRSEELHMIHAAEIDLGSSGGLRRLERRRNPRYPSRAEVEIVDLASGIAMTARTADLSRGGCYVDMLSPLPKDTVVKLRLTMWHQTWEAQAKVVYAAVGMGMGLMFGVLDAAQRATMESWIIQLSGQQPC